MQYLDLGRVANAQEARSCAMTKGSDGHWHLVILSSGFVVSTDLNTAKSTFCPFPEGYVAYPFGSMGTRTGKVCFGAGKMFYEFDPATCAYTLCHVINTSGKDDTCEAWSPFEDRSGRIWFGAYPVTHLMSYDPKTGIFTEHGIMAEDQSYLTSIAEDKTGWIYCGMGTIAPTIAAFNPNTGEKRIIARSELPGDCAEVRLATDGNVYGALKGSSHGSCYMREKEWHLLEGGAYLEAATAPFQTFYAFSGFDAIHCPFENHPRILEQDLVDHRLTYLHPDTGETVTVSLDYDVAGAELSPITLGPDGKIYGTTNHPIQIFTYDPSSGVLTNFGRRPFARRISGWGNICAYASQGSILAGAAYCGGFIVRIDTNQSICSAQDDVNPHCEAAFNELLRPRSAAALPDGKTVAFSGFNIYGKAGGGMVLYDCDAGTCHLIPNGKLLPGHSTLAILPLSKTRLLCGTSIQVPGGGKPVAAEGALFEYDLETETVLFHTAPISQAEEISHLVQDTDGKVHGITGNGVYFTWDPSTRTILTTCDLSRHGTPVRAGMTVASDGTVYGLLTGGIYRISPGGMPEFLTEPPCPITGGMALLDGKLYFSSNSHLWCCTL